MGVEERRRGFYAHWVRQFFNRCKGQRRRRDLGRADIERFLGMLRDGGGVEPWQVEQAQEALEIYYEQFRGIALAGQPQASAFTAGAGRCGAVQFQLAQSAFLQVGQTPDELTHQVRLWFKPGPPDLGETGVRCVYAVPPHGLAFVDSERTRARRRRQKPAPRRAWRDPKWPGSPAGRPP